MSTHVPGFQSFSGFFASFFIGRIRCQQHKGKLASLTVMLLVANLANAKRCRKMTETLANGYSSESTRRELSNEYRHDRV